MVSGPTMHSISLPSRGTEPHRVASNKAIVYITDFLSEEKAVDWIPLLRKALYSLRTFRFFFSFHNWNHATSAETTFMNQKKKNIYKSSIVENMAMIVNKDINIE